jgi:tetratricopeptide (TPR) repeat protein
MRIKDLTNEARLFLLLTALVLLLGGWLRLAGWTRGTSDFSLADSGAGENVESFYRFHPDEQRLARAAFQLKNLLDPPLTVYGMLPVYLARVTLELASFWTGHELAGLDSHQARKTAYLSLRLVVALLSWASLWLVWLIGRRFLGEWVGLVGAAFVAVAPIVVQQAHFFTVDSVFLALMLASFYALARAMQRGDYRSYLIAGALIGATGATRLNGLTLGLVLLAGHFVEGGWGGWKNLWRKGLDRKLWAAGGAALVVLGLLQPFLLADPGRILRTGSTDDFLYALQLARGDFLHPWSLADVHTVPYLHYWTDLWPLGVGWPLTVFFALGLVYALWKRRMVEALMAGWCLFYFLQIGGLHNKHLRYLLPMLPFLSLLAADLCAAVWRRNRYAGSVLAVGLVVYTSFYGLAFVQIYRTEDSRIQAARWVAEELPAGARIGVERGGFSMAGMISDERFEKEPMDMTALFGTGKYMSCRAGAEYLRERMQGLDYIAVIDANRYRQFVAAADLYPTLASFYHRLWAGELGFELVRRFKVYPSLAGVVFRDDDAEPSFLGFDHPAVMVFERAESESVDRAWERWLGEIGQEGNCVDGALERVAEHWRAGDWPQALQATRTAVQQHPRMKVIHYVLAHIYGRMGDIAGQKEALRMYEKGFYEEHSAYLIPWASGLTLAGAGVPDLALSALLQGKELLETFPTEVRGKTMRSYIHVGSYLHRRGQVLAASQAYQLATEIDPRSGTFMRVGEALDEHGEWAAAAMAYERVLKMDPDNQRARANLGWDFYLLGDLEKAAQACETAFVQGRHSRAGFNLGLIYLAQGREVLAEKTYARAVDEFGRAEGVRVGAPAALRALVEQGDHVETSRRILERHWPQP